jgi:holo-[acyl-carrier protein] synthase
MIVGTGIDIAEVGRVAAAIERFGRRFVERIFTAEEIRYCESKQNAAERFAARFAAKEAALKAIGTGWNRGIGWREVEVRRARGERPTIHFSGRAAAVFDHIGAKRATLSLTHTKEQAMAMVILED